MTFKTRKLIEEAGWDNLKNNWGKYATGAGLGALGTAAAHIMGDSDVGGGFLDDLKSANQEGHFWNTLMDKGQGGLENLKFGGEHSTILQDNPNFRIHSYTGDESDSSHSDISKLRDIVSKSNSTPGITEPAPEPAPKPEQPAPEPASKPEQPAPEPAPEPAQPAPEPAPKPENNFAERHGGIDPKIQKQIDFINNNKFLSPEKKQQMIANLTKGK